MTKIFVCCTPYLMKHTSYDCDFWYTFVKWWHLQVVFSFFQNFDFLGCYGGKKAKNALKWQKILSHSVSQQSYIIWLWFLVHMCKMVISPAFSFFFFCHFFKILFFQVFNGLEGQKMIQNYQFQFVMLYISGTVDHIIKVISAQV